MLGFAQRRGTPRAARRTVSRTGRERFFRTEDVIVSKTDLKGRITYANDIFVHISGYREEELLGAPHSIIRHPEMPRAIFQLLWERIAAGEEVFAFVVNLCKNGDHYWVFAHVTPTRDLGGNITAYHSNRRVPDRRVLPTIRTLYDELLRIEADAAGRKEGLGASRARLAQLLEPFGGCPNRFAFHLLENGG